MSDLVGNPEDRFSCVAAHMITFRPISADTLNGGGGGCEHSQSTKLRVRFH